MLPGTTIAALIKANEPEIRYESISLDTMLFISP